MRTLWLPLLFGIGGLACNVLLGNEQGTAGSTTPGGDDDDFGVPGASSGSGPVDGSPDGDVSADAAPDADERPDASTPRVMGVGAGENLYCAYDDQGAVYCWGMRVGGSEPHLPRKIQGLPPVRKISVGHEAACGIAKEGGQVWCWGMLPIGGGSTSLSGPQRIPDIAPAIDLSVGNIGCANVAVDSDESLGVNATGSLSCWGAGAGRFGLPNPIPGVTSVRALSIGLGRQYTHGLFLKGTDGLSGLGSNHAGQLVSNNFVIDNLEIAMITPPNRTVTQAVAGDGWSCVLDHENEVWCQGFERLAIHPAVLAGWNRTATQISEIQGRNRQLCARGVDGKLSCWGVAAGGVLGTSVGVQTFACGAGRTDICECIDNFGCELSPQLIFDGGVTAFDVAFEVGLAVVDGKLMGWGSNQRFGLARPAEHADLNNCVVSSDQGKVKCSPTPREIVLPL